MITQRRHVIIEGMDGSGKDTLIADLLELMPEFVVHERASTSLGGPVSNLAEWVVKDTLAMEDTLPPSLYNRHPIISEPIYAPVREVNPGLRGVWGSRPWVQTYKSVIGLHAVLVVCSPPFSTIQSNLLRTRDGHMPGVIENMTYLHTQYSTVMWPGVLIRYNYRNDRPRNLARTLRMNLKASQV
jgi:hypothetical protein